MYQPSIYVTIALCWASAKSYGGGPRSTTNPHQISKELKKMPLNTPFVCTHRNLTEGTNINLVFQPQDPNSIQPVQMDVGGSIRKVGRYWASLENSFLLNRPLYNITPSGYGLKNSENIPITEVVEAHCWVEEGQFLCQLAPKNELENGAPKGDNNDWSFLRVGSFGHPIESKINVPNKNWSPVTNDYRYSQHIDKEVIASGKYFAHLPIIVPSNGPNKDVVHHTPLDVTVGCKLTLSQEIKYFNKDGNPAGTPRKKYKNK